MDMIRFRESTHPHWLSFVRIKDQDSMMAGAAGFLASASFFVARAWLSRKAIGKSRLTFPEPKFVTSQGLTDKPILMIGWAAAAK